MEESVHDRLEAGTERHNRKPRSLPRSISLFRANSLANLISPSRRNRVLHSYPSTRNCSISGDLSPVTEKISNRIPSINKESSKRGWTTIVTVILVEATGLPNPPSDGSSHNLYCKIRLGSEASKSKAVPSSPHPEWREKFKLHLKNDHLLRIFLWDKGKQKNFMGSCVIDLSSLEKERSHELWQPLDDGFGTIHYNVTMCVIRNIGSEVASDKGHCLEEIKETFGAYNLKDWQTVGQFHVKVICARGLSGKPNAYCTLEIDNERVQTPSAKSTSEPVWNKSYVFNVHDVTSTLDLKMHDSSIVNSLRMEYLGRISIPLLRIKNGETRWYALKDKSKRSIAKGNCPRVLLQMSLIWNPINASLRLFRPSEIKHIPKKPPKFDLVLVYGNLVFVKQVFEFLVVLNEGIKVLFEWDNRELSAATLAVWLVFWYYFQMWHAPLLLLLPFLYYWFRRSQCKVLPAIRSVCFTLVLLFIIKTIYRVITDERSLLRLKLTVEKIQTEKEKNEAVSLGSKIVGLPELTLAITGGVEFCESVAQRVFNLVSFKVPFLSYLMMILLVIASIGIYLFPFNYVIMGWGVYKYTRKHLNPQRRLNNDLLDFILRIPDNEILKDWEELIVPEPLHHKSSTGVFVRSNSNVF